MGEQLPCDVTHEKNTTANTLLLVLVCNTSSFFLLNIQIKITKIKKRTLISSPISDTITQLDTIRDKTAVQSFNVHFLKRCKL